VVFFQAIHPQKYVNFLIVGIGLAADIISLALFFGAISTPASGSNFYVNSREFLAWVLIAIVYSIGLLNALFRRRWHKLYGNDQADHSILNIFARFPSSYFNEEKDKVDCTEKTTDFADGADFSLE
jgi:Na+/H+ antiporter NhaD/arsenite permease-like protein